MSIRTASFANLRRTLATLIWVAVAALAPSAQPAQAQAVHIDPEHRHQIIDGFGTCNASAEPWWQALYFDDLRASILRVDLTPQFKSPISDDTYLSPWFHNHPPLPGPDGNNVRTYTDAADYVREFAGRHAPIAVMGPDIDRNVALLDFTAAKAAGLTAQAGAARATQLGDFKLYGSIWSPAPWLKLSSGNRIENNIGPVGPKPGTLWPFIWNGTFAGGRLDTSGRPVPQFDDRALGGTGPTSALTQFARCTAAWLRGFQNTYSVRFYGISIQNELNFEEFYSSCTYPSSEGYLAALKAVRSELDRYPDLRPIRLLGPEDLLGGDPYTMWQLGAAGHPVEKNLQYLRAIGRDPAALAALDAFCIHGYAADGVTAAGADPQQWRWWVNGWETSPKPGIPGGVQGFAALHKRSWLTETSGEKPLWLAPESGKFPSEGAWSLALKIQQALTAGEESAYLYWTFAEANKPEISAEALTSATTRDKSPKYVAAKHFFRYIRPNAQRVDANVGGAPALSASAFVNSGDRNLVVVLVNAAPTPIQAALDWAPAADWNALQTYTSEADHYWQPNRVSSVNGRATVTVPGFGVVTLQSGAE